LNSLRISSRGLDRQHLWVAHVDMTADGKRAAGDGPLAQLAGALFDGFDGQLRFQLPQSWMPSSSVPLRFTRGRP